MNYLTTHFLLAFITSLIGIALFIPLSNAQDRQLNSQCPVITVDCPTDCPKANEYVIFRAKIEGGESNITPTFNWSIFNGRNIRGQGTAALTVRIDNHCEPMTATVNVDGLASGCARIASCSTVTDCCWVMSRKFDQFSDINCEDEMARLDQFALQLEVEPSVQGYVIFYGGRLYHGRLARHGESEARAGRIKEYLLENRRIDPKRIVMVNGGYREGWSAELWIVPTGAQVPTPTTTLKTKDIKFRRGKIRKSEYDCGGF